MGSWLTEWVSAPAVVNCKPSAKNGIRLCMGSSSVNIAPQAMSIQTRLFIICLQKWQFNSIQFFFTIS